ncbi:uncharacterized protein LOC100370873 [Saccoglossus kowalevskii]|uniref:Uncharacterized protein LOC100370873 isoform X1 n=1 Tax=Saccoglossus kowalevskii TaxID=10224 RepID=A0ABM0GXW8_SACKO|nr:PREDICTED: uncharacterized protein LOC100370873 isoform X1 [Saccoglossus kowalevskii]
MPLMYSCGCCSLKAGNMVCCILILIEMVINLVIYVYGVLQLLMEKPNLDEELYIGMEVAYYVLIGLFVIVMVMTSIYFCGAVKGHPGLLVGWIVTLVIYMVLELAATVYLTYIYHNFLGGLENNIFALSLLIWYILRTLLHMLYLMSAVSQYQEITEKQKKIHRHRMLQDSEEHGV